MEHMAEKLHQETLTLTVRWIYIYVILSAILYDCYHKTEDFQPYTPKYIKLFFWMNSQSPGLCRVVLWGKFSRYSMLLFIKYLYIYFLGNPWNCFQSNHENGPEQSRSHENLALQCHEIMECQLGNKRDDCTVRRRNYRF